MWGQAMRNFSDIDMTVTARQVQGPSNDNTGYGVSVSGKYNLGKSDDLRYMLACMKRGCFEEVVEGESRRLVEIERPFGDTAAYEDVVARMDAL